MCHNNLKKPKRLRDCAKGDMRETFTLSAGCTGRITMIGLNGKRTHSASHIADKGKKKKKDN